MLTCFFFQGDPIEAEALARTFGASRKSQDPVYVGSIKPNIGHTEPVSGIASLLKTSLLLQNKQIPPHINFKNANPSIPLDKWNLQLPMSPTPWPKGKPLRASINNFGYGGTNVHAILEGPPSPHGTPNGLSNGTELPQPTLSYVFLVSSRHQAGVVEMSKNLSVYIDKLLETDQKLQLGDLAYTLGERRSQHNWKVSVNASNAIELADRLKNSQQVASRASVNRPRIAFIFTGQGAQWSGMGRELTSRYPAFDASLQKASKILQSKYGASFALYDEFMCVDSSSRMDQAAISQPATVVLQLCLVDLLKSWNVEPSAVVSHSSGEIAAAYAAGVLTFDEAIGTVYCRGMLASKCPGNDGGMMAVRLGPEEADDYLAEVTTGKAIVACVNSPSSITLSGDNQALDQVAESLEDDGVSFKRLNVPLAYHSHHMQAFANDYRDELDGLLGASPRSSKIPFASPTVGRLLTPEEAAFGANHWVQNLVSPVLFSDALHSMVFGNDESETALDVVIEIGPHSALSSAVREVLGPKGPTYFSCLRRSVNAVRTMHQLVSGLLTKGCPVLLSEVNSVPHAVPRHMPGLPSYVWDHTNSYVAEPRASRENRYRKAPPHELLGSPVPGTVGRTAIWRNFLRLHDLPWLADHQLESQVVLPAAGYISMAIEAVRQTTLSVRTEQTPFHYQLRDVDVLQALVVPPDTDGAEVALTLQECDEKELDHSGWYAFEVCSVNRQDVWIQHCRGFVMAEWADTQRSTEKSLSTSCDDRPLQAALQKEKNNVDVDSVFHAMRQSGIYHGPSFQNLVESTRSGSTSITAFELGNAAIDMKHDYIIHPTSLDSVFQTCYFSVPEQAKHGGMTVPRSIGSMSVSARFQAERRLWSQMSLQATTRQGVVLNGIVSHDCNRQDLALKIDKFRLQKIPLADSTGIRSALQMHSQCRWEKDVLHDLPTSIKQSMAIKLSDAGLSYERELHETAYHLMIRAIRDVEGSDRGTWLPHHKKYYEWLQGFVGTIHRGELPFAAELGCRSWSSRSEAEVKILLDTVRTRDAGGELLHKIGSNLAQIMSGNVAPLQLMMEDGLLDRYYATLPLFINGYKQLRKIVQLYSVKQPGARDLEIGAGTGGATGPVIEEFASRADDTSSPKASLVHIAQNSRSVSGRLLLISGGS